MQHRIPIVLLAVVFFLGCEQGGVQEEPIRTDPATLPVAEDPAARAEAELAAEAAAATDLFLEEAPSAAQLLFVAQEDTRPESDRAGAVFVPMSTFSVERDGIPNEFPPAERMAEQLEAAGVSGDRFVIVGEPIPAGRAYAGLDYLGLGDRATLLEAGPAGVAQAPAATPTPAEEEAREGLEIDVREDMIVDAEWVHERLDDASVVILDARPPDQFSGETPGEGIDRPGHIPGARNVFWETLVQSPDAPQLRDEQELRRIFDEAGVGPGDTVVTYCRTGGQASFLYTVARHLGYDVRLYDGSYIDWSGTDYPVEEGAGSAVQ